MAVVSVAAVAAAGSMVVPTTAAAKSRASQYAAEQCGNGYWAVLQYPSYEECYMFAVQYYFQQGGGGGVGGSGGGVDPRHLPQYNAETSCDGGRIKCNDGS